MAETATRVTSGGSLEQISPKHYRSLSEVATSGDRRSVLSMNRTQSDNQFNLSSPRINITRPAASPASSHRKPSKQYTPREYASAINAHAGRSIGDSLYPGHHFRNLAAFLWRPYEQDGLANISRIDSTRSQSKDDSYVSLVDFRNGQQAQHINTIEELEKAVREFPTDSNSGQILFMRGYQPPDWLNAVGSSCRVDPDFLQRHLSFAPTGTEPSQGRAEYFSLPSLPSAYSSMLKLHLPTIGSRTLSRKFSPVHTQHRIDELREEAVKMTTDFIDRVLRHDESEIDIGDSLIREYSIHDLEHFSFEQDISITISHFDGRWIVICWLDVGRDLELGQAGPWSGDVFKRDFIAMTHFPTIQNRPLVALKDHIHNLGAHGKERKGSKQPHHPHEARRQSASILHIDHGWQVDSEAASHDPFYAISSIFHFVAFAECQFLNMMDLKLRRELDREMLRNKSLPTLSNLIYSKQILERHTQHIQEPLAFLEGMTEGIWPKIPGRGSNAISQTREKTDASREHIIKNFRWLLDRARYLSAECDRRTNILMNEVMVRESQKAIEEAERVTKLTTLAFFFIPLSFTSSLFGMNFKEINGSTLRVWVWLAVSAPVLIISLIFLIWDISDLKEIARALWRSQRLRGRQKFGNSKSV